MVAGMLLGSTLAVYGLGTSEARRAEGAWTAKDYQNASISYARAAQLLPHRADLWDRAGISAGVDGEYATAIEYLGNTSTHSQEGWAVLAFAYMQTGDMPAALRVYQDGLKAYPSSATLYGGLAHYYRTQKDWDGERDALQNQIRLQDGDAYAHYRLGLLLSFHAPEEALKALTTAASLDPGLGPSIDTLRSAMNIADTQTDSSQKRVTVGRAIALLGEWDLAATIFAQAVTLDADNAEAWAWLGEAEQQTGGDGSAALDRAISIDSESAVIRGLRGLHWSRVGNYDRMFAEYSLAARLEPNNPAWQAAMGDANLKRGDLAAAIGNYKAATDLAPEDASYWTLLAMTCAQNGVAIEEQALPAAQKAAELAPQDPAAWDALGFTYYSSGRYANAEESLKKAIALDVHFYSAYLHLAMNYLAQGNRAAAQEMLIYVRDHDPNGIDGTRAGELLSQYFP